MVTQHADAAATITGPAATEVEAPVTPTETPSRSGGRAGKWVLIAIVVGYVLHVAWRIYLSRDMITPAAHADEDGYLLAARALTGGPGGITTENEAFRRMGYPMLISPVYWFTTDAFNVYRGVLILNALLNALVFPLSYLFARRVLDLSRRAAVIGAFVAATLPAVVFYSEFAMTDAVLAPIALGWLILAHQWLAASTSRGRLIGALGSGAVAGFFYVVHVRGTMVVLAHVLLAAVLVLLRKVSWKWALASVVTAGVVTLLDRLLKLVVGDAVVSIGRSPKGQTINAVTTLGGMLRTIGGADGQLWYLCVATLGIGAVGLIASAVPLANRTKLRAELADPVLGPRRIMVTAVLATTLFIALGSAAALPTGDQRINYFAYPRYIHLLFPVWLLIGLMALRTVRSAKHLLWLGGSAVALTGITGAVVWYRVHRNGWGIFLGFDAPETSFLGWRWDTIGIIRPTAVALIAFAAIVALMLRPRFGLPVVLAGFTAVQLVTMPFVVERVTLPMESYQYTAGTPRVVRDGIVHPGDVVAFARRQQAFYLQYNLAREVNWAPLLVFDQTKQPVPDRADVVIAPWHPVTANAIHWDGTEYGFHVVATDEANHWAVWRRN